MPLKEYFLVGLFAYYMIVSCPHYHLAYAVSRLLSLFSFLEEDILYFQNLHNLNNFFYIYALHLICLLAFLASATSFSNSSDE